MRGFSLTPSSEAGSFLAIEAVTNRSYRPFVVGSKTVALHDACKPSPQTYLWFRYYEIGQRAQSLPMNSLQALANPTQATNLRTGRCRASVGLPLTSSLPYPHARRPRKASFMSSSQGKPATIGLTCYRRRGLHSRRNVWPIWSGYACAIRLWSPPRTLLRLGAAQKKLLPPVL